MVEASVYDQETVWNGAERLRFDLVRIGDLKPFPGNSRRGDVPRIAESLKRFGQVRSIVVTEDLTIVAGHHVTKAAALLGWTHVAAIPAEFDSRDDARDYLVADNQLSLLGHVATTDQMTLLELIEERGTWDGTGFSQDDLDDARALSVHKTEMVREDELKRHDQNYKDHPDDQIEHLTRSLKEHGFYRNIVIAKDGTVLAGHGILQAARAAGLKKIPVTRMNVDPGSPEALKIVAGDNELGKLAEVDDRQLTEILAHAVQEGGVGALLGTGFDAQTLASLVLVTRPESEVADGDAAAELLGLDFEPEEDRISLVLAFDSEEARDSYIDDQGIILAKKTRQTWSARWPPRPNEDLSSLRVVS